jgi:hypothetical protein
VSGARIPGIGLAIVATVGLVALALYAWQPDDDEPRRLAVLELAEGEVQGDCLVVVPPAVDPCEAAQGTLRYVVLGAVVNANQFKAWRTQNPGEWARLNAHMAAPACSVAPVGQPQDMRTFYGAALYGVVQAYACARGTEPLTWPPANPPLDPNRADKTPPTAPGPLTVTP